MNGQGIVELRNRYMQERIAAQESGITLPPFEDWVKSQVAESQPKPNTLASLAQPNSY